MPPHSIGSGTISFGLVSIPIKLYTAASSAGVSLQPAPRQVRQPHQAADLLPGLQRGRRARRALVKGYEFAEGPVRPVHRRGAEGARGRGVEGDRHRRVRPAGEGRPDLLREDATTSGPTRAARRPTGSSPTRWPRTDRVALAKFVMRGKESLVLIRAAQGGLMLHTMYFADEVRDFGEIDKGADREDQGRRARAGGAADRRAVARGVRARAVRGRVPPARAGRSSSRRSRARRSPRPAPRRSAPR